MAGREDIAKALAVYPVPASRPYQRIVDALTDHDPFNIGTSEAAPGWTDRLKQGLLGQAVKGVADMVTTPARQMQPNPYPAGSEEAQWYADNNARQAYGWGPEMALNMVGVGGPAAMAGATPKGAIGSSGSGIKAYHGSPHDFDRFDLSKIGTGEGAQAYGHGLYFAEREGTAKAYRDQLAKDMFYTRGGEMFDPQSQLQHLNVRVAAHRNGSDLDATIARAQELLPKSSDTTRSMIEHDIAVLRKFKDAGGIEKQPGKMYEVNINARPEQFLDWDKPLSAHGSDIRSAIAPLYEKSLEPVNRMLAASGRPKLEPDFSDKPSAFYGNLNRILGGVDRGNVSAGAASQALREAGIPGIKYLDQGSRGAGEGSRNYVVFDDKLIDILRKYGIALPGAGAGIAGSQIAEKSAHLSDEQFMEMLGM